MAGDGERRFTGILHDLSSRVRIEQQLREQAALARLGEMAAVLAHEVRNPLAGIRGALQVIAGRQPADAPDGSIMREIIKRIDSLSDLMKDLLLFARPPQPRLASIEITPLVEITLELLRADPAVGDIQIVVEGIAPAVQADAELLKIVLLNLLLNGVHAMGGSGRIVVMVEATGGWCRIVVRDSGPGIAREHREKIFTPFFTTKARGTGLGLPTARRIVEAHGGTIELDCPEEGGTAVTIRLPYDLPHGSTTS